MRQNLFNLPDQIRYDLDKKELCNELTEAQYGSYLKSKFRAVDELKERFSYLDTEDYIAYLKEVDENTDDEYVINYEEQVKLRDYTLDLYENSEPLTYLDAFSVKDNETRIKFFELINIGEMIANMGATRLNVAGIELDQKMYDHDGNYLRTEKINNVFEVYEVKGDSLELTEPVYAVKCWCNSTTNEHWLWIESEYKDDPLSAIASTFRIHENLVGNIKELKRQGDILLVEMYEDIEPTGNILPLTKEQYFSKLTVQT